jgi:hypothetical protein
VPATDSRSFGARLVLITALGAVWRLLYLFVVEIDDPLGLNDSIYYSIQAGLNSEGRWFEDVLTGQPGAEHGPLTSLYLTPWSLGASDAVALQRLAITLLGIVTVAVVGLLGRHAARRPGATSGFADRCGLVAAGIAALYPNLWLNDSVVMSEGPTVLLVAVALLAALRHHDRPTVGSGLLLGALAGLATLARSELLLLIGGFAVLSVLVLRRRRQSLGPALAVVVAGVLTLAPWVGYNLGRFHQPVLLTTNDGNTLLGANCERTFYDDIGGWDVRCLGPLDEVAIGHDEREPDASDRSRARRADAFEYIGDHLPRVPVVVAARLGRLVDVYGLRSMVANDVGEDKSEWAVWLGIACWWVLAALAVAGWGAAAARRLAARWWLLVPVLAVVATAVLFYGAHRIRAPAEPSIVVLAAVGVTALAERRRRSGSGAASPDGYPPTP